MAYIWIQGRALRVLACVLGFALASMSGAFAVSVTTYHNDTLRTGWNKLETQLTVSNVLHGAGGNTFKRTSVTTLDDQVDAQPLVLSNQAITGKGVHDVVYVATEGNTLYAIDANTGVILRQRNFGPPVPIDSLPGGCNNNGNNIGITSTPVIDQAAGTMFLIADRFSTTGAPKYYLHAIDVSSLADVVPPVVVSATGTLTNGHAYHFNARVSRQRAALLLSHGKVYAGFASYCDVSADQSRGWVLGWDAATLAPLAANELANKRAASTDTYFLTAIWMSGFGLASSTGGDVYFVTGNSDPSGDSIDSVTNIAESAVQLTGDLGTLRSVFTPDNAVPLEQGDGDFGSGGLTLLPPQPGLFPNLAVAAGKDGQMYLLNADNLNNNTTGRKRILGAYGIGSCWCGASYYTASDGVGRVVSSGGGSVGIWKVRANANATSLTFFHSSADLGGVQAPGFFTSVSSNGTTAGTAVIWAVSRPDGSADENVSLFAFNGAGATLFQGIAGTWPNTGGNSNLVPTVANGHVYVGSFQSLAIFGLSNGPGARIPATPHRVAARASLAAGQHEVFGTVRSIGKGKLVLAKRAGALLTVDTSAAIRTMQFAEPTVGHGVLVRGTYKLDGSLAADTVLHAKDNARMWQSDR